MSAASTSPFMSAVMAEPTSIQNDKRSDVSTASDCEATTTTWIAAMRTRDRADGTAATAEHPSAHNRRRSGMAAAACADSVRNQRRSDVAAAACANSVRNRRRSDIAAAPCASSVHNRRRSDVAAAGADPRINRFTTSCHERG
mmetsp:Transcript_99123/g.251693  ORF Transcript_99123/g.251693 Transcript_99123/m.251693 type:complete len:143 (+) Transcript_99123:373-801(+)